MFNRFKKSISIETVLVAIIACCLIFLNQFAMHKVKKVEMAVQNSVFIMDHIKFDNSEEFSEELKSYLSTSYRMVELYDENIDLLFQIQFSDEFKNKEDIKSNEKLLDIIKHNKEGQAIVNMGDVDQAVYFKWVDNNRGERRLLIMYSTKEVISNMWTLSLICYIILILVFALLTRLHLKNYKDKVELYRKNTDNILQSILNK